MSKQCCCDVLIVGGGPAGLAAAIALRMRGADVLVADALKPPIDKACGEGLMPDSRRDLASLGVELTPQDGASFSGIRFANWPRECLSSSVSAELGMGEGLGIRRPVLHSRLVERATELGVRFRWNTHVALREHARLNHEVCRYRYLVGADGHSSRVRAWAGLASGKLVTRRFGFRQHFRVVPWSSFVEVHWGAMGQAYITPIAEDEICLVTVTSLCNVRSPQVIDAIPFLRERLKDAVPMDRERGAITTTSRLKRVVLGNVALLGDASGSVDAITGEGLAVGFRQAALLGPAVERDNLNDYADRHQSTLRLPQMMARVILLMDKHPALRNRAMRVLADAPGLFRAMLDLHLGEETIDRFVLRHGAEMGLRLALSLPARN